MIIQLNYRDVFVMIFISLLKMYTIIHWTLTGYNFAKSTKGKHNLKNKSLDGYIAKLFKCQFPIEVQNVLLQLQPLPNFLNSNKETNQQ